MSFSVHPKTLIAWGWTSNPSVPYKEIQQFSPITWQALTDESSPDGCVTTTLEKIRELDPYFR